MLKKARRKLFRRRSTAAPTDLVYDSLANSFTNVSARLNSLTSNVGTVVVHLDAAAAAMCDVSEDLAVLLSSKPHLRSDVSHYLNGVNQVDALVADFRNAVKNTVLGPLQSMLTQQAELQKRRTERHASIKALNKAQSELEKLHEKSMKKTQKTGKPESRATAEKREKLTRVYGNCVAVYKALTGALIDEFRVWTSVKLDHVAAIFRTLQEHQVSLFSHCGLVLGATDITSAQAALVPGMAASLTPRGKSRLRRTTTRPRLCRDVSCEPCDGGDTSSTESDATDGGSQWAASDVTAAGGAALARGGAGAGAPSGARAVTALSPPPAPARAVPSPRVAPVSPGRKWSAQGVAVTIDMSSVVAGAGAGKPGASDSDGEADGLDDGHPSAALTPRRLALQTVTEDAVLVAGEGGDSDSATHDPDACAVVGSVAPASAQRPLADGRVGPTTLPTTTASRPAQLGAALASPPALPQVAELAGAVSSSAIGGAIVRHGPRLSVSPAARQVLYRRRWLRRVTSGLDARDLCRLACVCRRFARVLSVGADKPLWRRRLAEGAAPHRRGAMWLALVERQAEVLHVQPTGSGRRSARSSTPQLGGSDSEPGGGGGCPNGGDAATDGSALDRFLDRPYDELKAVAQEEAAAGAEWAAAMEQDVVRTYVVGHGFGESTKAELAGRRSRSVSVASISGAASPAVSGTQAGHGGSGSASHDGGTSSEPGTPIAGDAGPADNSGDAGYSSWWGAAGMTVGDIASLVADALAPRDVEAMRPDDTAAAGAVATGDEAGDDVTGATRRERSLSVASASSVVDPETASSREQLRNVLGALVVCMSPPRYVQGLNFIARMLLHECEGDEAMAFTILAHLFTFYDLDQMFAPDLRGLALRFSQFDKLLRRHLPGIYAHSESVGVTPPMYSATWFLALFANFNSLRAGDVKRVWDMFMLEGWPAVFRAALAVMRAVEHIVGGVSMEGMLHVLQYPRTHIPGSFDIVTAMEDFPVTEEDLLEDMA